MDRSLPAPSATAIWSPPSNSGDHMARSAARRLPSTLSSGCVYPQHRGRAPLPEHELGRVAGDDGDCLCAADVITEVITDKFLQFRVDY